MEELNHVGPTVCDIFPLLSVSYSTMRSGSRDFPMLTELKKKAIDCERLWYRFRERGINFALSNA